MPSGVTLGYHSSGSKSRREHYTQYKPFYVHTNKRTNDGGYRAHIWTEKKRR